MKKEKGFTLIELLAVIIILGILMMVAIPAVTTYINSSRKSAYVDNVKQYVSAAQTAISSNKGVTFYDEKTLLLVPVGTDEEKSFIKLEKGGQSPYSSDYSFAYVGVTYDGATETHTYYFTAVDSAGQGLKFTSLKNIEKNGESVIEAGLRSEDKLAYTKTLRTAYANGAKGKTNASGIKYEGDDSNFAGLLTDGGLTDIDYILVCGVAGCPDIDYGDDSP